LATALNMDYKTIRYHLEVLVKYGIITRNHDGNSVLYFISNNMANSLNSFDDEKLNL
jgi:predicted transcriptional regulator